MSQEECAGIGEVSAADFRDALSHALTPVTIVATDGDQGRAGVTCSAVCSVCDAPPTITVCVNRKSDSNAVIKANRALCVNWLRADHAHISQLFARDHDFNCAPQFVDPQMDRSSPEAQARSHALRVVEKNERGIVVDGVKAIGTEALNPWFERLNSGPVGRPHDRAKIGRVIRDLFLTDWGSRLFVFENFNGTPLQAIRMLTMQRAEFSGSGVYGKLARKVCGIEEPVLADSEYKATAAYAKALDSARQQERLALSGTLSI